MRSNKGITLVALVITIVVLLILSGITIAMATGEGSGLFAQAKSAKIKSLEGEARERIQSAQLVLNSKIAATGAVNIIYDATSKNVDDSNNIYDLANYVLTELEGNTKNDITSKNLSAMTSNKLYKVTLDDNNSTITIQYNASGFKNSIGAQIKVFSDYCAVAKSNFDNEVQSDFSGFKNA